MSSCLVGFIGISGCGQAPPTSGVYVNSLAGITLKGIRQLTTDEVATVVSIWEEIEQRAIVDLRQSILRKLAGNIRFFNQKDSLQVGRVRVADGTVAAAPNWRGLYVKMDGGQYTEARFNKLRIYSDSATTTEIGIWELQTNTRVFTKTAVALQVGWNDVQIASRHIAYQWPHEYFIGYDATSVSGFLGRPYYDATDSGLWNLQAREIAKATSMSEAALIKQEHVQSVELFFSWGCSIDAYICSIRELLTDALLYRLGVEVLNERLASDRLNAYTLFNRERAEKLMEGYIVKYNEALANLVKVLPVPDDDCFECDKPVQKRYARL